MNKAYSKPLLDVGSQVAKEMGISDIIHKGVYTCLGGPNFETVAELKMLSMVGVDAVGRKFKNNSTTLIFIFIINLFSKYFLISSTTMIIIFYFFQGMSTVHEVITARHCDLEVFAFSLITNECVCDYDCHDEANHEDVMDVGKARQPILQEFLIRIIQHLKEHEFELNFDQKK